MGKGHKIQYNVERWASKDTYDHVINIFREIVKNTATEIHDVDAFTYDFLEFVDKVFNSRQIAKSFLYLCSRGAVTALIMQEELLIPEATVYRILKKLRDLEVVKIALKIPLKHSKGGPRPSVFYLRGATEEEIKVAVREHGVLVEGKGYLPLGEPFWRDQQ